MSCKQSKWKKRSEPSLGRSFRLTSFPTTTAEIPPTSDWRPILNFERNPFSHTRNIISPPAFPHPFLFPTNPKFCRFLPRHGFALSDLLCTVYYALHCCVCFRAVCIVLFDGECSELPYFKGSRSIQDVFKLSHCLTPRNPANQRGIPTGSPMIMNMYDHQKNLWDKDGAESLTEGQVPCKASTRLLDTAWGPTLKIPFGLC